MTHAFSFACSGEAAARAVTQALHHHGFRVMRSFDLRSALASLPAGACPLHGAAPCTCQYVVLLAYAAAGSPLVIATHSQGDHAEVRLVEDTYTTPDPRSARQAVAALCDAALSVQAGQTLPWKLPRDADAPCD